MTEDTSLEPSFAHQWKIDRKREYDELREKYEPKEIMRYFDEKINHVVRVYESRWC